MILFRFFMILYCLIMILKKYHKKTITRTKEKSRRFYRDFFIESRFFVLFRTFLKREKAERRRLCFLFSLIAIATLTVALISCIFARRASERR